MSKQDASKLMTEKDEKVWTPFYNAVGTNKNFQNVYVIGTF